MDQAMEKAILNEQINKAIEAHDGWKVRLQEAINTGTSKYTVEGLSVINQCDFGRWLYFEIDPVLRSSEYYEKVANLHQLFHEAAANVLKLALQGEKERAMIAMGAGSAYEQLSAELISAMTKWRDAA